MEEKNDMSDEEFSRQLSEIDIDDLDSGIKPIIHKNINDNPDSLTVGTPGKLGEIKVYGNYDDPDSFKQKILNAILVRKFANAQIEVNI
jgi:hypothetical protein